MQIENLKHLPFSFLPIFIALLLCTEMFAQRTDVVIMNNDDHITGEIKRLEVGILVFKTDDAGTINIQWNKIKSITTENFYEVQLQDGRIYYGSIEPADKDEMLLIKGVTLENKLFMRYIVKITRLRESFWEILDGYVKLGLSFTKASQIGQVSFGGNGKYRTKINLFVLNINSLITTTNKEETSRKQDVFLDYQKFLEQRWFYSGSVGAEENTELGIKLRVSIGGGLGNNFIQSNVHLLYANAGVTVNRELYFDSTEAKFNVEGMVTTQYQIFIYDHPKVSLETKLNIFPSITDFGRVRSNLDIALDWEIFIDFYWVLSFYFSFDNKATSTASETDFRIDTSFKYEL